MRWQFLFLQRMCGKSVFLSSWRGETRRWLVSSERASTRYEEIKGIIAIWNCLGMFLYSSVQADKMPVLESYKWHYVETTEYLICGIFVVFSEWQKIFCCCISFSNSKCRSFCPHHGEFRWWEQKLRHWEQLLSLRMLLHLSFFSCLIDFLAKAFSVFPP